ncbi:hypothetical protein HQQ80_11055 [Microbacteriaceae bacterium VKM Ac-2855]|nr:hypothetical protein [Microbacteriaceae bacterium VKM Ac-2855]
MSASLARVADALATPQMIYGTLMVSAVIGSAEDDDPDLKVLVAAAGTIIVLWLAHVLAETLAFLGRKHATAPPTLKAAVHDGLEASTGVIYAAVIPCLLLASGAAGLLPEAGAYWAALAVPVVSLAFLGLLVLRRHRLPLYVKAFAAVSALLLGVVIIVLKIAIH